MSAASFASSRRRSSSPWAWAFLAPALIVLSIFVLWSFAQVFALSFTRYPVFADDGSVSSAWIGVENYQRLLVSKRFWFCALHSLIYLLVTPALILVSLGAAFVVNARLRFAPGLALLLFLPVVTPTIVGAIAWRVLFEQHGVLNSLLNLLALPSVGWLHQYPFTILSPMIVTLWKGFGFYMMIFLAALSSVPRELEEAARIDGGGRWTVFRHVILPSIWPVLALVFIISSISALKVFDELFVTVKGTPIEQQTAVPLIFDTAFNVGDFGYACAMGIALFLVILSLSLANLRLSSRQSRARSAPSPTPRPPRRAEP